MKDKIRSGPFLQMDETTVQVHGEESKMDSSKSYIWITKGGSPENQIALYEYNRSRSSKYIKVFVEEFSGYLQSDGFQGYDSVLKDHDSITHVGCLAHARRKIYDPYKADKKVKQSNVVINKIQKIYATEKKLRQKELTPEEFLIMRKEVKPFVMGRKNFLFAGSIEGADAMCFYYSLIETAKLNGLNPYAYLKWLFDKAPLLGKSGKLDELAPWSCNPEEIKKIMLLSK
ncbi:MAG: transposase [Spirochaetales bacterium]|nr:transposase [Spirochaetales bacterium]